jgi:hypothetical protein
VALLAASTFFVTSIEAQIIHQHRSVASEATCPLCHLFHRVAMQPIAAPSLAEVHPLIREVFPRETLGLLAPSYSPSSPRAPPAA